MLRTLKALLGGFLVLGIAAHAQEIVPPAGSAVQTKSGGIDRPPAPDQQAPVLSIVVPGQPPTTRPLADALLWEPLDREPGNAALLWLRAGRLAAQVKHPHNEEEDPYYGSPANGGMPLNKLPKDRVAALLKPFEAALRVAHEAARREDCDWGDPPLTLANLHDYLPLDDIQSMRTLARVLTLEHRLALANGDWKGAVRTVRTGLTLARHMGRSNLLITHLVAIAIEAIMMGRVEEMLTQPDAPHLYWALTDLPTPLIEVGRSIRYEMNTFHRSFPGLRKLEDDPTAPLDQGALQAIFGDALRGFTQEKTPAWQQSLMMTALVSRCYPAAKKSLLERGVPAEKVEKLPTAQVVGLYFLNEYNAYRDDVLRLQNLPPWQARPLLEEVDKQVAVRSREQGNPFLLLMPAIAKVDHASVRAQRTVVLLRTVEAIRLHAAHNAGALPGKLADIKVAPVPLDPATGRTFEGYYKVADGRATLEVPPLPPMQPWHAHHFEFTTPSKEKP